MNVLKSAYKIIRDTGQHFLFPRLCLGCKSLLLESHRLCSSCLELFTLIDPYTRCRRCFCESRDRVCLKCRQKARGLRSIAGCFECCGPAAKMKSELEIGKKNELIQDFAAWLIVQFTRLSYPLPDIVTVVPSPKYPSGLKCDELLAKKVAQMLNRPFIPLLKRQGEGLFKWRELENLSDKVVLLIALSIIGQKEIEQCAAILKETEPTAIYGLGIFI